MPEGRPVEGRRWRRKTLTAASVRAAKPREHKRRLEWDGVCPGLALRITSRGVKSFVLVTRYGGKLVWVTLGRHPAISLQTARVLAREGLERIARGEHPRVAKRSAPRADAGTVETAIGRFVHEWCKPRNRRWYEQERLLKACVLPHWGSRPLAEISRGDVVTLTDALAARTPTQANRTLSLLKTLFVWALDRDLIPAHPAVGLRPPGAEHRRTRTLTDDELRAIWRACSTLAYPWGFAMQLMILTATRRSEVGTSEWDEFVFTDRLWTIPPERSKTKLAVVVPLSPLAMDVLAQCPRLDGCRHVFATRGRKPITGWAEVVVRVATLSQVSGWSPHDFRRTARTGLSKLGVPTDIAERALGHVIGGVRARYDLYAYLPEKRDALDRWAQHVATVLHS
jgi:integrase